MPPPTPKKRSDWPRLLLAVAQLTSVMVAATLVAKTGINRMTLWATLAALALAVFTFVLFR